MVFDDLRSNFRITIDEYLRNTTIHGLLYLSECKQLWEKLSWVLVISIASGFAFQMIYTSIDEFEREPIITTLETTSVVNVPFPAITIRGSAQANPWGFTEKIFNMLTFYDPTDTKVIEQSQQLRNDMRQIMQEIISKMDNTIKEQRSNWTLEDLISYPKSPDAPNLLEKQLKTVKYLASILAGISLKDVKTANKIENDIKNLLVDAFFEEPSYLMKQFLTVKVKNMLENYTKYANYTKEISICQNEEKNCMINLRKYYNMMYLPYEVNKFPYYPLGFGNYMAYFSRLMSSSKSNVKFFNSHKPTNGEKKLREFMAQVLWNLAKGHDMAKMSLYELVGLLHQNPDENDEQQLSFANPLQKDFDCIKDSIEDYRRAWEDFIENRENSLPCSNSKMYEHLGCCKMSRIIQGHLPIILKVMKYSIQPVLLEEPLEDFIGAFDNLKFMHYNNLTTFGEQRKKLMENNFNPRVFMCKYAQMPKHMKPSNCKIFYTSLTNEGIGYSFNKANFWDIFSKTPYNELYAKIMRPKGFNMAPSSVESHGHQQRLYPRDISFPVSSGTAYGLEVRIHIQISIPYYKTWNHVCLL